LSSCPSAFAKAGISQPLVFFVSSTPSSLLASYAKVSIKRRKEYEKYKETRCFICIDCFYSGSNIMA
jgi:hypothetical protein